LADQDISKTAKITAKSKRIEWAPPITLVENSKTKIEALAYYFHKGDDQRIALKINFYTKNKTTGDWTPNKDRTFSLAEGTVGNLKKAIANFEALLGKETNQEYLLVPLGGNSFELGQTEKQAAVKALLSALGDPKISAALSFDSIDNEIFGALQGRIRIAEMERATSQLSLMLDADEQSERMYQIWFEEHFWVMGNAYVAKDEVRGISRADKVDLLLQCTASGRRDILELKRPDMSVLHYDESHQNYYFSAQTSKALGQCQRYLEVFSEEGRHGLRDGRHILARYPEAIVVIGRSHQWDDEKQSALRGFNSRLNGIKVMTYDHVLARAYDFLDVVRQPKGA
jgi:hypothetical protein